MVEHHANPWDIIEADFPATGTPVDQWSFLLGYAVLAPSRHNIQPWRFKVKEKTVELYADRSRSLPVADPDDREMIIGCGAALTNLLIALRHFGHAAIVEIPREWEKHGLLVQLHLEKGEKTTEEEGELFHAILQRRTNRQLFENRPVPPSLLSTLENIAGREGTRFQIVEGGDARYRLTNLIATGDHLLWADDHFRQEIMAWMRPQESQSHDGVPVSSFGKGEMAAYLGPLMIRTFMEHGEAEKEHDLAAGSPVFAVLWTFSDTWRDWLMAGQALERILLYARTKGIWASFFSQPIEIAPLRSELRTMFARADFPQLILRMGYGPEVPPTPRRSVHDVLIEALNLSRGVPS